MKIVSILFALGLLAAAPQISYAAPRASVAATINGDMITSLQLEKSVKLAFLSKGQDPNKVSRQEYDTVRESVLKDLIKESILLQEAKKQKINISDKDIDAEIASSIQRANLTKEQFLADLAKQGYDEKFYREKVKNSLITQTLINRNVLRKIIVTNDEILEYYLANGGKVLGKASVALIVYKDSADMDEYAENFLKNSKKFEKTAEEISVGPYAEQGGVFGEMNISDLAAPIQAAIQGLEENEVSKVFTLNGAYAQVKLLSRTTSSDNLSEIIDPAIVTKIQDGLRMQKAGNKIEEYIAGLEKKAIVKIK